MKLLAVIIIALLLAILYNVSQQPTAPDVGDGIIQAQKAEDWRQDEARLKYEKAQREATAPVATAPAALRPAAVLGTPAPSASVVEVDGAAAVAVRGAVVSLTPDGALVDCETRSPNYNSMLMGFSRAGMNAENAGAILAREDAKHFGPPKLLASGHLDDSEFVPRERARGVVLLTGVGMRAGESVHVVAARAGNDEKGRPRFTAAIRLKKGAWMWNKASRNPLERGAY